MVRQTRCIWGLYLCLLAISSRGCNGLVRSFYGSLGSSTFVDLMADDRLTDRSFWETRDTELFGWDAGGRLTLSLKDLGYGRPKPLYLYVMTEDQLLAMRRTYLPDYYLVVRATANGAQCHFPAAARYEIVSGEELSFAVNNTFLDQYTIVLVDCSIQRYFVMGSYSITNEDGSHLSYGDRFNPQVFTTLLLFYLGLMVCWLSAMYMFRDKLDFMQTMLLTTVLARVAFCAAANGYWTQFERDGLIDSANGNIMRFCDDMALALGMLAMLLLAAGWRITRPRLTIKEARIFSGFTMMYLLLSLITITCNAASTCNSAQLFKYIIVSFVVIIVIVSMNCTIMALRAAMSDGRYLNDTIDIYARLRLFTFFRICFVAYLLVPTVAVALNMSILSWRDRWSYIMLDYAGRYLIELLLLYEFRPTKANTLFVFN